MEPNHLLVGSGEFQVINFTASCTDPKKLVLETALHKTFLEDQAQWKLFKVISISKNMELMCSFICGGKEGMKVFNITVFCECCPRGPAPRDRSLCLQTHNELLCHCSWALSYGLHIPGLLDPGTGSESAHTLPWPPRTLPATGILRFAQKQTIQAGLDKPKSRFPLSPPSWGAPPSPEHPTCPDKQQGLHQEGWHTLQ